MTNSARHDAWSAGDSYEHYMGRWSHEIARGFLEWLGPPPDCDWLDVGCGTGALSRAILENCAPRSLVGIDPSEGFVAHARKENHDDRARFETGGAENLPIGTSSVDVVASALVLNFVPNKVAALEEMRRVVRPGGLIGFNVWDYPGGGMGIIDEFWKAAAKMDARAAELDEAARFPFCTPDGLAEICTLAGMPDPSIVPIEIVTAFDTFDDFIHPFTLGTGPAPGYYTSLDDARQAELRDILARNVGPERPIRLKARAWAVKCMGA